MRVGLMVKCPKCGKEVSTPKKTWKMAGRKDKSGKRYGFTIGLFEHCGKTFRSVLGKRKNLTMTRALSSAFFGARCDFDVFFPY
ncbi:MAG: hypothetical protein ACUVUE_02635 [Candidatus Bathycorpusculaceae bacterium]